MSPPAPACIHAHRTARRDRHHLVADFAARAVVGEGPRERPGDSLPLERQADHAVLHALRGRLQGDSGNILAGTDQLDWAGRVNARYQPTRPRSSTRSKRRFSSVPVGYRQDSRDTRPRSARRTRTSTTPSSSAWPARERPGLKMTYGAVCRRSRAAIFRPAAADRRGLVLVQRFLRRRFVGELRSIHRPPHAAHSEHRLSRRRRPLPPRTTTTRARDADRHGTRHLKLQAGTDVRRVGLERE